MQTFSNHQVYTCSEQFNIKLNLVAAAAVIVLMQQHIDIEKQTRNECDLSDSTRYNQQLTMHTNHQICFNVANIRHRQRDTKMCRVGIKNCQRGQLQQATGTRSSSLLFLPPFHYWYMEWLVSFTTRRPLSMAPLTTVSDRCNNATRDNNDYNDCGNSNVINQMVCCFLMRRLYFNCKKLGASDGKQPTTTTIHQKLQIQIIGWQSLFDCRQQKQSITLFAVRLASIKTSFYPTTAIDKKNY